MIKKAKPISEWKTFPNGKCILEKDIITERKSIADELKKHKSQLYYSSQWDCCEGLNKLIKELKE